jgi:hypothetical protein
MGDLTYVRFRRLAAELARGKRTSIEMVFEPIGLMVQPEGERFDYWCTPTNSVTFACTGGDGVHFGHLLVETRPASPVVMTVPMTDTPNLVIASDFHDFLRLGYYAGFFSLEQFVYNWDEAVAIHTRDNDEWGDWERTLLQRLRTEFALEPFADISAQIRETHEAHAASLEIPILEEWNAKHGV